MRLKKWNTFTFRKTHIMFVIMKPQTNGQHEYFLTVEGFTEKAIWKHDVREAAKYDTRHDAENALRLLKEWRDDDYQIVEV